jgi:hypothetical protein
VGVPLGNPDARMPELVPGSRSPGAAAPHASTSAGPGHPTSNSSKHSLEAGPCEPDRPGPPLPLADEMVHAEAMHSASAVHSPAVASRWRHSHRAQAPARRTPCDGSTPCVEGFSVAMAHASRAALPPANPSLNPGRDAGRRRTVR